ncbi:hypothetical protein GUITHDRAFT_96169 [Guillardia theta CCMP2712]|uniref:Oxysterol binding protein n=2 Tax=Guillardia theta TaxID=55529 RepID=L1IYL4_GUITC|nr:hypothetical protein GUITHDRAFT_96169 [Guillardia theta CCMP2712]EKX40994.1 hypothetical protein GUITHDRAFT_96169 [Guillardia theta CCMP2712]|mmetsp:Transcript_995/g.3139  ORF Transcript_995/g.3139 Transcript_995/m.3139 type:complete len:463 (+) Transcript_995:79-1467(+)|eukprot:XP_005827974.1 hypothetical protein GUITHDRAFT_96169 [Guillardia theta CCMP2712]
MATTVMPQRNQVKDDEIVLDGVFNGEENEDEVEEALRGMCVEANPEEEENSNDYVDISDDIGIEDKHHEKLSAERSGFRKMAGKSLRGLWNSAKKLAGRSKDRMKDSDVERLLEKVMKCRHKLAHPNGGLINTDYEGIKVSRSVVAEVVKQMGRKLLSGQNLLSVTFPVRCCQPRTILECAAYQFCFCPHYLSRAAMETDPVERLKHVTACFIACIHTTSQFVKPFNPTLGETLQASFDGGVRLYLEQTSHHPPVTSWQVVGPNNSFQYIGWSTYEASFGYNKLYVKQSGIRMCQFPDGTTIEVGFTMDRYNNVYWGDVIQEVLGGYTFLDTKNSISCTIELNPCKGLPSDTFIGSINRLDAQGEIINSICNVEGSFLGFLDFNGHRYWDISSNTGRDPVFDPLEKCLPSDSRFREDRNALVNGEVERAQVEKVRIEERQRRERRLRAAAAKGGPWIPADVK